MGSLDAWLAALFFSFLGGQVWVVRLVQILLFLATMVSTVILGKMIFRSEWVGVLAAWFLAIPTVNVLLYTTASLGGYGEALLLGNLLLISALRIADNQVSHGQFPWDWLLLGFWIGLGWWVFGLTMVYSLPAIFYLLWRRRRLVRPVPGFAIMIAGVVIGSLPWWMNAYQRGFGTQLGELGGSAIAGVEGISYLHQILQHFYNLVLLGGMVTLGLRPPWGVGWLALPLIPFMLIFWMVVFLHVFRRLRHLDQNPQILLLLGVILTLVLAFILTPFGADPSGRYFLPLAIPLSLFAADWILSLILEEKKLPQNWLRWSLIVLVLGYHLWGILQSASRYPPGITTQFNEVSQTDQRYLPILEDFLRTHNEMYGYTNYWVAYPLAYLSAEELIYLPRLPYHEDFRYTVRDDRYAPYDEWVSQSEQVAYITTKHPQLDEYLREEFRQKDIAWQETWIGDFHVFFDLSRPVRPPEIGLGENHP
jgi:4-amino-4-deoxy-L-arabinose transferase-like glycosyltransferase